MEEAARRVAQIFGVNAGHALPTVSTQTLHRYHTSLPAHLSLPFDAQDTHEPIEVAALVQVQECPYLEVYGLFYRGRQGRQRIAMPFAELEAVQDAGTDAQLLADYRWWFWHYR